MVESVLNKSLVLVLPRTNLEIMKSGRKFLVRELVHENLKKKKLKLINLSKRTLFLGKMGKGASNTEMLKHRW